jgi:hypothetical protein
MTHVFKKPPTNYEKFLEKFRTSIRLYETCLADYDSARGLDALLENLCVDKNSLYQNDHAKHARMNVLFDLKTPLSFKVLRYVFAEDEYYFKNYYKGREERELAKALEIVYESIKIPQR